MALTFADLGIAFGLNLAITLAFLAAYSVFSSQPINARVYYTKWFMLDDKDATERLEGAELAGHVVTKKRTFEFSLRKILNHTYNWIHKAMQMPERELIAHAGLDAAASLRLFKVGFLIFMPVMLLGATILFPICYTSDNLQKTAASNPGFTYSEVEKLSLSNIPNGSDLLWAPTVLAWVFAIWSWYILGKAYKEVAQMRIDFLADQKREPNQFTVLVRQVPKSEVESVEREVDHFFRVNHPHEYLLTQPVYNANKLASLDKQKEKLLNKLTEVEIFMEKHPDKPRPTKKIGWLGLCGPKMDAEKFFQEELEKTNKEILHERERLVNDASAIMPAAFVSFKSRWGAAVAAQTQQCKDSSRWITMWAPEPKDVNWSNLPIPYLSLTVRRIIVGVIVFLIIFFYNIPVGFVQSLATLQNLQKLAPWLKGVLNQPFISSVLQAFLPGLALKIFLAILPKLLVFLSQQEGYIAISGTHFAAAGKYFYFVIVVIFFSNVLIGSAFAQFKAMIENPTNIPSLLGNAIPTKSSFFITYTMLDAWSGVASEVFRLSPLVMFHIKNALLVRTPQDRIAAMDPEGAEYYSIFPRLELYFLLPFVYCVIAPLYLPFAVIFYMFGYIVYRNQFINVYDAEYETAAAFWPHVHSRLIATQIVQFITLIGLFTLKEATLQTFFIIPLPFLAIVVDYVFIQGPYRDVFFKMAIEEATRKDTIDRVKNPNEDVQTFLARSFLHPSLQAAFELLDEEQREEEKRIQEGKPLVQVKRHPRSQQNSPAIGRSVSRTPPIMKSTDDDYPSPHTTPPLRAYSSRLEASTPEGTKFLLDDGSSTSRR